MPAKKLLDYLIIGQGIAGTLIAYFLQKEGKTVHVIDNNNPRSSSKHAAGIINPITGRRYVKSWRIEDLLPFATKTYREIESEHKIKVFNEIPLIRTLFDQGQRNHWMLRLSDPTYTPFMDGKAEMGAYAEHLIPDFSYGQVLQSARLDIPALIAHFRQHWISEGILTTQDFDIQQLELQPDRVIYESFEAEKVIFCEGNQAKNNPYFNHLPFGGAKGEVFEIEIPGVKFQRIIKRQLFIVPLSNGNYWIGSTNRNQYENDLPSADGKAFLIEKLAAFLKADYKIVSHNAAIRPTVKDRRPFLGIHPLYPQLALFNGLGTKGASLGPFWARHFIQHLIYDQPLEADVNIERFNISPKSIAT